MKFILFASGINPARPSTRNPGTTIPTSTWGLLSRLGHSADAEAKLASIDVAKYGAERLCALADLVVVDEKRRLVPATPPHETDKDRGDVLVDVADVFTHGVNETEEAVLDDDGKPVTGPDGKPVAHKVRELRLKLLLA